jgi:RNA polymerase sigma-70 factor (ECF subfamily)
MIPNGDQRAVDTDEDLAARLVRGDPAAFEALVDRHEARIRTLCWRITGSQRESEDLTQEVFLRVYRHRDTYRPDKPFRQWLNRICVNVCLSQQKRQRLAESGVRLVALDEAQDTHVQPGVPAPLSPEGHAAMADGVRTVQATLARLTEPFRSTLILRVFGELSYQEIAEALGCSLGTVMSRVNRARNLVKDQLKDLP